jgi:uncharacterized protein YbbC (DUF1343 family)
VKDRKSFEPVIAGLAMVKLAHDMYPDQFRWKDPPYEYVLDQNPIDVISGTNKIREAIEQGSQLRVIEESWKMGLEEFRALREEYLLYE